MAMGASTGHGSVVFVYHGTNGVALAAPFSGSVIAPDATIHLGTNGVPVWGSVAARRVWIANDMHMVHHPLVVP